MARSRESFDLAARAAALELAAREGDEAAASSIGCAPATIRSWRRRSKADDGAAESVVSPTGTTHADDLQREAEEAGETERALVRSVAKANEEGDGNAARAFSAAARDQSARRAQRESEARAAREHAQRIAQGDATIRAQTLSAIELLLRSFLAAIGLGWSHAHDELIRALMREIGRGEWLENGNLRVARPEPETTAARAAIDRQLAREHGPGPRTKSSGAKDIDLARIEAAVDGERAEDHMQESARIASDSPDDVRATPAQNLVAVSPPDPAEDERRGPPVEGFLQPITPRRGTRQGAGASFRWYDQ
jgi:hypothetical protein